MRASALKRSGGLRLATCDMVVCRRRSRSATLRASVKNGSDAHEIVADVIDDLTIACRARAIELVLQVPVIERRIVAVANCALELVAVAPFVDHRVPALAVVRRLDQGKGQIAQCVFVVGEIVGRDRRAISDRSFLADPVVNAVTDRMRDPACRDRPCSSSPTARATRERPKLPPVSYRVGNSCASTSVAPLSDAQAVDGRRSAPEDASAARPASAFVSM